MRALSLATRKWQLMASSNPPPERETVQRGDHWLVQSFHMVEELLVPIGAEHLTLFHAEVRELLDVGTRHEGLRSAAGDDEHAHALVSFGFVQCLVQLGDGVAVQRVELFGTVDGDGADAFRISDRGDWKRTWASRRF
jgi:hypothetical protein